MFLKAQVASAGEATLVRAGHFLGVAGVACCLLKFAEVLRALEVVHTLSGSGPISPTGKSGTESGIGSGPKEKT